MAWGATTFVAFALIGRDPFGWGCIRTGCGDGFRERESNLPGCRLWAIAPHHPSMKMALGRCGWALWIRDSIESSTVKWIQPRKATVSPPKACGPALRIVPAPCVSAAL